MFKGAFLSIIHKKIVNQRSLNKAQSSKVFGKTQQPNTQNHGQGTYSAKVGNLVWPKISKMPLHLCSPICLPKPKSLGFWKKRLPLGVRPWFIRLAAQYQR